VRLGVGLAALAVVAALAFFIGDRGSDPEPVVTAAPQSPSIVVERTAEPPIEEAASTFEQVVPPANPVATSSWQEQLATSSNYLEFVDRAYPAASEGDASAQFALYQALEYCEDGYRRNFDRPGKRRTLDEALNRASAGSLETADVRDVHRRCEALMARGTGDLGSPESWLAKASAAGLPAAQARKALDELRAVDLESVVMSGRTEATAKELEEKTASARAMLLGALVTGDSSATWDAADTIYYLTGSGSTADTEQWVWKMAACLQGYDCAPGAAWVAAYCRQETVNPCLGGESGTEIIRQAWVQASGQSDTSGLDERAQQLADRLNSGEFSDADLKKFMKVGRTP
jgi:hypothetical protein